MAFELFKNQNQKILNQNHQQEPHFSFGKLLNSQSSPYSKENLHKNFPQLFQKNYQITKDQLILYIVVFVIFAIFFSYFYLGSLFAPKPIVKTITAPVLEPYKFRDISVVTKKLDYTEKIIWDLGLDERNFKDGLVLDLKPSIFVKESSLDKLGFLCTSSDFKSQFEIKNTKKQEALNCYGIDGVKITATIFESSVTPSLYFRQSFFEPELEIYDFATNQYNYSLYPIIDSTDMLIETNTTSSSQVFNLVPTKFALPLSKKEKGTFQTFVPINNTNMVVSYQLKIPKNSPYQAEQKTNANNFIKQLQYQ
jgi:hypothetical protein